MRASAAYWALALLAVLMAEGFGKVDKKLQARLLLALVDLVERCLLVLKRPELEDKVLWKGAPVLVARTLEVLSSSKLSMAEVKAADIPTILQVLAAAIRWGGDSNLSSLAGGVTPSVVVSMSASCVLVVCLGLTGL